VLSGGIQAWQDAGFSMALAEQEAKA